MKRLIFLIFLVQSICFSSFGSEAVGSKNVDGQVKAQENSSIKTTKPKFFFQSPRARFNNAAKFPFDGTEQWYGIFDFEIKPLKGIELAGRFGTEKVLYKSKEQLKSVKYSFEIHVSEDPSIRYVFSGFDEIKPGTYKKGYVGVEKCISYATGTIDTGESSREGEICKERHSEIEFDGKKTKLIAIYGTTFEVHDVRAEFFYERDGKRFPMGKYRNGEFTPVGDLNRDGIIDFVVLSTDTSFGEDGGADFTKLELLLSDKDQWKKVFSADTNSGEC